ncbi:DUF58 domain-containing protein [Maritimibacter sp. 55A14]|uniref:DUF58 domain-containing protein n=1 Tax=Maritimibacter sp. 55A14 TaxID=2174844 RepID=UPI000D617467|nr:DUF58 domain-containing protein [Maritimibacter sp. 55A14]PWE32254.1 DUF58 domain-containing protein [Maritimibacter sp. 55A14]
MSDPAAIPAAWLRQRAEAAASGLPPLLAEAEHLAATVILGEHGRRRAGLGDQFWQYRHAHAGDAYREIDWRRSGRADATFVREKEWQAAQSVLFWIDTARSMSFTSDADRPSKGARARLLGLAAAVLLNRGGERIGLMQDPEPPRHGEAQLIRVAAELAKEDSADYGIPAERAMPTGARAVLISDFLGDWAQVEGVLAHAADRGVKGVILQVLDPQEEAFPFDGRTIFQSMAGVLEFETLKAGELRNRYLERLAERKARLSMLADRTGWQYQCHHTGESAQAALLWLYGALEGVR